MKRLTLQTLVFFGTLLVLLANILMSLSGFNLAIKGLSREQAYACVYAVFAGIMVIYLIIQFQLISYNEKLERQNRQLRVQLSQLAGKPPPENPG